MLTHRDITPHVTFISKSAGWIAMCLGAFVFLGWIVDDVTFTSMLSSITMSSCLVFGVLMWWTARSFNRIDQQRRLAIRDAHDAFEQRVLERTSVLEKAYETLKTEIVGRKRVERALRESSTLTQSVLDSLTTQIAVVNRDGLIVAVNDAWRKCTRISSAQADDIGIGMDYLDICRRVAGRDARLAQSMADTIRSILDGRPVSGPSEYEHACRLGSEVRWFFITIVPNRGIHAGAIISQVDMTERKRAEEAVRESEGRFRAIFNQASVGIAEVRPDGRFLRVNAKLCDIMGRQEDVLQKMTFQELTHPDDLPQNLACLQQTLNGQRDSCSIEKRYLRSDGVDVWCRLSISLVRTSTGSSKHFISVVEDISERKCTTDALRTIVAATASVTDEDFFRSLVSHLSPAMGVRYAFVGELVEGKMELVRTLAVWAGNEYGENLSYQIQGAPCERVLTQGVPCFYPYGVQEEFPADVFLSAIGAESYYGLPLLDRGGHVLGLLAVIHDQPFSLLPGMEEMLIVFAARAGVELERKRTLSELRFSDQALRQLIEEREQLAQDLHDGIIQAIYAAWLGLEEAGRLLHERSPRACEQIQMVIGDLNSLIEEVRNHIVRKPREIKNGPQLKLALERLVRVLHTCPTMRIVTVIERAAADRLLPAEAMHVYYIAAEALSNAVRHAQAQECLLALRLVKGAVRLEVSDNGCGFDPSLSTHAGHGLRNLAGRAAKLGTELHLETSAGGGARLIIDIPKEPRDAQAEAGPYPTVDCRRS